MADPILDQINTLECNYLNAALAQPFELAHVLGSQSFLHLLGLSDFWSSQPGVDFGQHMADLAMCAHSQATEYLTLVLVGTPQRFSLYVSLGEPETTLAIVEGVFPGILWERNAGTTRPQVYTDLAQRLSAHVTVSGIVSGIPSRKISQPSALKADARNEVQSLSNDSKEVQDFSHFERVVRSMMGTNWVYIVRAYPRPHETVLTERLHALDILAWVASEVRGQIQKNTQIGQTLTASQSTSYTETVSGELVNYRAQYLMQLLEHHLQRLDRATSVGQWTVDIYYGATTNRDVQRLRSLLMGTLAGHGSKPQPLRASRCEIHPQALSIDEFKTHLTSDELALFLQFPREEVSGYAIHDLARFDVDFEAPTTSTLVLGTIQHYANSTHNTYRIRLDDLSKHAVVLGVTGSGKTTTVFNLLDHCVAAHLPFLVIEPVKTEYRTLRLALASSMNVRVYTLGNEVVAPFRLNPFEFEVTDTLGSGSLLNHIDFLKAAFNAAFVLYAPMPYILETALYEIYQDKGWDLATGKNTRLPDAEWANRQQYPIFPTLTDLYSKVEVVTNRLHYFTEIEQNVKAGLKARIGSLRLGAKGFMLDTPRGIPLSQLLTQPVILELDNIGNDEEKTFIMGLFLARLYEYRRLQAAHGTLPTGLQHVLVFEEAHRLLKQTSTQVDIETANPRAQAIETFTNMLSEIRGYGQGVIVAEQIPSKLTVDVLKNTNLKIIHRLVAQDDRMSAGQTMNLNTQQILHIGTLAPGQAAVYAEGNDHAYLIHMENYKFTHKLHPMTDADLAKASESYAQVDSFLPIPKMNSYGIRFTRFHSPDMTIYQHAGIMLESEECQRWWISVIFCVMFQRSRLASMLAMLPQLVAARFLSLSWGQAEALRTMIIVRGGAQILYERGTELAWTFPFLEDLRHHLTQGLLTLAQTGDLSLAHSNLDYFTRKYTMRTERKQGPFPACVHCLKKCLYHAEVSRMLSAREVTSIDSRLAKALGSAPPRDYEPVVFRVKDLATQWLEGPNPSVSEVAFCIALHAMERLKVHPREQDWSGEALAHLLLS